MRKLITSFYKFQLTNFNHWFLHFLLFSIAILALSFLNKISATLSFILLLSITIIWDSRSLAKEHKNGIFTQLILHNYSTLQIITARFFALYLSWVIPLMSFTIMIFIFSDNLINEAIFIFTTLTISLPLLLNIAIFCAIDKKLSISKSPIYLLLISITLLISLTSLSYNEQQINDLTFYLKILIFLTLAIAPTISFATSKKLTKLHQDKFLT